MIRRHFFRALLGIAAAPLVAPVARAATTNQMRAAAGFPGIDPMLVTKGETVSIAPAEVWSGKAPKLDEYRRLMDAGFVTRDEYRKQIGLARVNP